ncbi:MAG: RAMP superfamily CRISPR-associated protein [Gammaproteobacteria bacterium]|nr:RAMP superfamily CRISPR-associated protein [Gammaproteobacteria bacterium]
MTSEQFEYHELVLVPLTPIHVGGGDEAHLGPEDYRLKGLFLERVDLGSFLLSAPDCETLLRDMSRDLPRTLSVIRDRIPDGAVTERIAVSQEACDELRPIFRPSNDRGPRRQEVVHAFLRSGGFPTLPGSSLKGCLRTAWLARCTRDQAISERDLGRGKSGKRSDRLTEMAFAINENETATDPFRDVTVTDSRLPESATRVDTVSGWKYDRDKEAYTANPSSKIQLMRERLRSVTDGGEPPVVHVRIGFRFDHVRERRSEAARSDSHPKLSPKSIFEMLSALEDHHAPLWKRETGKFFSGTGQRLEQALGLFAGLSRGGNQPVAALARIGWAAHAEAKSIAGFRAIHRPQPQFRGKKGEYVTEGSARHVVDLPDGPSPFGWALLVMADKWRAGKDSITWLPAGQAKKHHSREQSRSDPGFRKGLELKYRKGGIVYLEDGSTATLLEDVREGQSEVQAEIDGGVEPVKVSEIEGLA